MYLTAECLKYSASWKKFKFVCHKRHSVLHLKRLFGEGTVGMFTLWSECRVSLKSGDMSEQLGSMGYVKLDECRRKDNELFTNMLERCDVIPVNERRYNLIRTNHGVITLWKMHLKFN